MEQGNGLNITKHPKTAALTGGIASGKSTVSRMFQDLGAYLIDADSVARRVVEPEKPAWQEIVQYFGQDILQENHAIDRKKLGAIIFAQPEKRQILNQITHPRVIEEIHQQEHVFHQSHPGQVVLIDVPLLIEASMHHNYMHVVLVYVPEEIQLHRLMIRDKISKDEARTKIRSQLPLSEKVPYATYVINNDGTLEKTREQVRAVYQDISCREED
jgi:dephospho-CoA kinase